MDAAMTRRLESGKGRTKGNGGRLRPPPDKASGPRPPSGEHQAQL